MQPLLLHSVQAAPNPPLAALHAVHTRSSCRLLAPHAVDSYMAPALPSVGQPVYVLQAVHTVPCRW